LRRIYLAALVALTVGAIACYLAYGNYSKVSDLNIPDENSSKQIYLNYNELKKMPTSTVYAELDCLGFFVSKGNWTGVRLGLVLDKLGPIQQAGTVDFKAGDGYSTTLSISSAMRGDVIIAYELNNTLIPEKTRLVIPLANGGDWISNITQIKLINPQGSNSSIYLLPDDQTNN